ncbi:MAG TPA: ATP-binding protein [Blastocatellia bacterium]|nr:ATP-binding protein [Blastocatellia bacterium]
MAIKSLRLRSKFYLSFGAVLLLGTLVAALMLVILLRSASSYKQVLETDRRVAELALTIQADKLRVSDSLRGRLLHPYGEFGDQEVKNLQAANDHLNKSYATTRALASVDPRLRLTLDQIVGLDQQKLDRLEQQILTSIEHQESAEAESLYFDQYLPARLEQQKLLDHLNELAAGRITSSVERIRTQSRLIGIIAVSLTIILITAGCALSYYLTRSFERPISELMSGARAIAAGELDRKLTLNRSDELGEMAEVMNQMVTNLRHLNTNLGDQVRRLREARDELAETQGQLVTQEKMAALGRLVAGVAHELNNPISFVYSNTILLKDSISSLRRVLDLYDSTPEDVSSSLRKKADDLKEEIDYDYLLGDIGQALEDSHEGARRVRDIVLNLRTFSRLDDTELVETDIIDGIESTIRILGQFYRPDRVVLHREYQDLPKIECFGGQLSQVWMNLLVNAAQAMNSKGDVWITAATEGESILLSIRDNGPGIPEEVRSKVFDPFFTTKRVGEGTGLGLSIVHSIIERHGGDIRVESEVGMGTTFTVQLPLRRTATVVRQEAESVSVTG